MGTTYVCYQTASWFSRFYQCLDVTRMAGSHFYDSNLMLFCQTEECFGHAYVIVEVALCIEYIIFLREYSGNQFFGGCLAICTCNTNHRNVELSTMLTGQILKGLQTVIYQDESLILLVFWFVDNGIAAAFFKGRSGKLITIKRFTF